jgi:hypothetical protein
MDVFWIIFIIAIIFHSSCQKYIYLKKLWNQVPKSILAKIANYLSKVHGIHNPKTLNNTWKKAKIIYFRWKITYVHYIEK